MPNVIVAIKTVQAVVDLAVSVLSLGGGPDTEQITKYFQEIEGRLDSIENDLLELKQALADLQIFIEEQFVKQDELELIAEVRSMLQLLEEFRLGRLRD